MKAGKKINMNIYELERRLNKPQPVIAKRKATEKQLKALAAGRAKREAQNLAKYAAEAESRYVKTKDYTEDFNAQKYINRLKIAAESEHLTVGKVHKALMHTFPYTTKEDNYKYQIRTHVETQKLRKLIADTAGQNYVNTSVNWEEFVYDSASEALVMSVGNTQILLKIEDSGNSSAPDFITIETR